MIDFFIIGTPKSGTTAVYEFLKEHPDIYLPSMKEPHFFADDLGGYKAHKEKNDFYSLYAGQEKKIKGDASIFHAYSETAIKKIKKSHPNTKLIYMIRNPCEAVPSFHSQLLFTQDETVNDLSKAWNLIAQRKNNKNIPKTCRAPKILRYDKIYEYATQYKKILSEFDKESVLVIIYDDFKKDPDKEMRKIYQHIGVKYSAPNVRVINPNTVNKYDFLARLLRHPPVWLRSIKRKILGKGPTKIYYKLLEINTIEKKRAKLQESVKNEIKECYKDEIREIQELLCIDLSEWDLK